jgi:hypothetical protein
MAVGKGGVWDKTEIGLVASYFLFLFFLFRLVGWCFGCGRVVGGRPKAVVLFILSNLTLYC